MTVVKLSQLVMFYLWHESIKILNLNFIFLFILIQYFNVIIFFKYNTHFKMVHLKH